MFGLGKKKGKLPNAAKEAQMELSAERTVQLETEITQNKELLQQHTSKNQALVYEKIGLAYSELGKVEEAITALEKSLEQEKTTGNGYRKLLSLYNQKRAMAAKAGDDLELQKYLEKIDWLMQISKDVTRGVK